MIQYSWYKLLPADPALAEMPEVTLFAKDIYVKYIKTACQTSKADGMHKNTITSILNTDVLDYQDKDSLHDSIETKTIIRLKDSLSCTKEKLLHFRPT